MGQTAIIWDSKENPPDQCLVFRWSGYDKIGSDFFLLRLLEEYSDELRRQLLGLLQGFAADFHSTLSLALEFTENARVLVWMSLLVEKGTAKFPGFLAASRLLAFEKALLQIQDVVAIRYVGPQTVVAESLRQLCERQQLHFIWDRNRADHGESMFRKIWLRLPHPVKGGVSLLRYLGKHWCLRKSTRPDWFDSPDSVFLFSYFIHLDRKSCEAGNFYSNHWEILPEMLRKDRKPLNWMHLFLPNPAVPDAQTGIRWLRRFNKDTNIQGAHAFLDSFLDWRVIRNALHDWLKILFRWSCVQKQTENLIREYPKGWLWPVLREGLQDSMIGQAGIQNLLWIHLFDRAMAEIPHQRLGLYLLENQGWERAFIHAWRKHGHGRLVGVAHATVRYWDLRYFDGPYSNGEELLEELPRPDCIAVNGLAAWKTLADAGQPMDRYVPVEALRYIYLNSYKGVTPPKNDAGHPNRRERLLVLGDIQQETTHRMLVEVERAYPELETHYEIWIKPHPANPVILDDYPHLRASLKNKPLAELFPDADIVLASTYTSAALDALCAGLPVIGFLDPCDFNFSPLRGSKWMNFISSASELIVAIQSIAIGNRIFDNPEEFFWLDLELPRWRKVLC